LVRAQSPEHRYVTGANTQRTASAWFKHKHPDWMRTFFSIDAYTVKTRAYRKKDCIACLLCQCVHIRLAKVSKLHWGRHSHSHLVRPQSQEITLGILLLSHQAFGNERLQDTMDRRTLDA